MAFVNRKVENDPSSTLLVVSGYDSNGVHIEGPIYPINKGAHKANSRPAIAFSSTSNIYLVAVADRVEPVGAAAYDRVAARFFDKNGTLLKTEYYLFDDKSSIINESLANPSLNVGSVQVTYNSLLDEFLVTVQRTTFYPKQLVTSKNGVWAQRLSFNKGIIGSPIELIDNGLADVHSHTVAYADVQGTNPSGGRYLLSYGLGNTLLLDSQSKMLSVVPLNYGEPKSDQAQPHASYGEVQGKSMFLLVYTDANNEFCQPGTNPCPSWSGVWGTFVDPTKTLYMGKPANTPFPISKIDDHFVSKYSHQPQVTYSPSKKSFYVVWRELPNPNANVTEKRTHIRGNYVDYYVAPNATKIPVPYINQVISAATGTCAVTSKPQVCKSVEDPYFPAAHALAKNKVSVFWHQNVGNGRSIRGKIVTIP